MATVTSEFEVVLNRMSLVVRKWPGQPLDTAGTLRLMNPDGQDVPLFWVFNMADELLALASALPSSRPIVGMRSLDQIVPSEIWRNAPILQEIAAHYADLLLTHFHGRRCVIGGNCQAAAIAARISLELLRGGADVAQFLMLDAEWDQPMPVPVKMMFGAESRFNPRLRYGPEQLHARKAQWAAHFPSCAVTILPGGHGTYFEQHSVGNLAREIGLQN